MVSVYMQLRLTEEKDHGSKCSSGITCFFLGIYLIDTLVDSSGVFHVFSESRVNILLIYESTKKLSTGPAKLLYILDL